MKTLEILLQTGGVLFMAGLTTHILDLTHGKPAKNVKIELFALSNNSLERKYINTGYTDDDGRLNKTLLEDEVTEVGEYELVFHIGEYFKQTSLVSDPPFLNTVPVRFGISDVHSHYHVPLLVSPWGYQIYRGS